MTWEFAAAAVMAAGGVAAAASMPKPPQPKTPGAPPAPKEGGPDTGKKVKKYKAPAQVFKDEDLRLGQAGRLGL